MCNLNEILHKTLRNIRGVRKRGGKIIVDIRNTDLIFDIKDLCICAFYGKFNRKIGSGLFMVKKVDGRNVVMTDQIAKSRRIMSVRVMIIINYDEAKISRKFPV